MSIQQSAIAHWEAGDTRPSTERLSQLADALGTTVGRLVTGSDNSEPLATDCLIPILAHTDVNEGSSNQACVPPTIVANHPHATAFPVADDSMNLVAPPGMMAICDPDVSPSNGSIVVVVIGNDGPVMRRWYRGGNTVMLVAESREAHDDIVLPADGDYHVVGTVVWIQSARPLV